MTKKNVQDLFDATAYDKDGDKLGSVKQVFVDDNTGQPTFAEVSHGLFGMSSSIVPLKGHAFDGEELRLAFSKDLIKDAPSVDGDKALSPEEQNKIYEHYELVNVDEVVTYGDRGVEEREITETPAATTGDDTLIRSEERLNVDKEEVATGRVGVRKTVVEDTETVEVPVRREEVTIEREPISAEEAAALKGKTGGIGDEEVSVTVHEERVNVSKEEVPVEKINLKKTAVEDTETVTENVRKERFETEGDIK